MVLVINQFYQCSFPILFLRFHCIVFPASDCYIKKIVFDNVWFVSAVSDLFIHTNKKCLLLYDLKFISVELDINYDQKKT